MAFIMESLDEELAAIEEAASYCQKKITPLSAVASSSCVETQANGNTASSSHNNVEGSFSCVSEEGDSIQSMKDVSAESTKAKQRNSMSLNGSMLPNLAELQDLAGSDSDEEESPPTPAPHVPNLKACGGPVSGEGDVQSMKDVAAVSTKAKQRNSISLNGSMMPNLSALQDLAGFDSDEEESPPAPAPHVPNLNACGGPQHRPLVGGFAAAAYEAARVDYYKKRGVSVRGHQPSKPKRSAPRYP